MYTIDSSENLSKMFADAGYNVDAQKAEIIADYMEEAGYQLATDNKNIFKVKFDNMNIEKTSLKDIVNFVENHADNQLNKVTIDRDEEKTLIKNLGVIRSISSSVIKYYNYIMEKNFSRDSLPGEFASCYKEAVKDYSEEVNPELNYEFFTKKALEKMIEAGKRPFDNIKTVAILYAPERVIKGPDYFENIMKELQQLHSMNEPNKKTIQPVR